MEFEWDARKAAANLRRHGVNFADAATALSDDAGLTIRDDHPDEERFVTIASDAIGRVLVIVYTSREARVRLISTRRATPRERRRYGERP